MNPNEKELLEKTYEMSKENNHILRGIRSSNRWASFFKLVYWAVIIGISVGAYYYVQPYTNKALNLYKSLQGLQGNLGNLGNLNNINTNNINSLVNTLQKYK